MSDRVAAHLLCGSGPYWLDRRIADYFSEAARSHTMILIEEVRDGGYARAD